MNVSEGDKAVIVFSVNPANIGRIVNVAEYIDGTFIENIGFNSVDTRYRIENVTDNKALTLKLIYSFNMNNNENDSNVTKDFDYNTVEVDIFTDPSFDEEVNTEWIMENYMGDSNTFFNEDGKLRVDVFDPGVNFFDVYMIREGLAFETGVNYMLEFEVFTAIDRKIKLSFRNDASVQTLGDLVLFGTDLGPTVVAYYFTYELSTISRLSIFLGTFDEYENNGTIYFDNFKVTKTDE